MSGRIQLSGAQIKQETVDGSHIKDDTVTTDDIKNGTILLEDLAPEVINAISGNPIIIQLPINSTYIQFPHVNPITKEYIGFRAVDEPAELFGGVWFQMFEEEGVFFRTEGDPFGEGQDHKRIDGLQKFQMQGHHHDIHAPQWSSGGNLLTGGANTGSGHIFVNNVRQAITDGVNGAIEIGKETRPINRLIRIWKRES